MQRVEPHVQFPVGGGGMSSVPTIAVQTMRASLPALRQMVAVAMVRASLV